MLHGDAAAPNVLTFWGVSGGNPLGECLAAFLGWVGAMLPELCSVLIAGVHQGEAETSAPQLAERLLICQRIAQLFPASYSWLQGHISCLPSYFISRDLDSRLLSNFIYIIYKVTAL